MKLSEDYSPPWWLNNGHVHTIFASKFLSPSVGSLSRERWTTPDDDFIDVDFFNAGKRNLIILGHGLEGDTSRPYISSAAKYFQERSWDVLAWNSRSCSGEMNRAPKLYCHGDTGDLDFIVRKMASRNYSTIVLMGFSMGGAIILNWLGRSKKDVPSSLKAAIAVSTPCDIEAASINLERGLRRLYSHYFLSRLKEKIKTKVEQYPNLLDIKGIDQVKSWRTFDERFSAPLNGLGNADEFYEYCSAKNRMMYTEVPTLLLNAKDDPILSPEDFPVHLLRRNKNLYHSFPSRGGHVGFLLSNYKGPSWAEILAFEFIESMQQGDL
jgi:predicted alpha/beta-fold hydrolase